MEDDGGANDPLDSVAKWPIGNALVLLLTDQPFYFRHIFFCHRFDQRLLVGEEFVEHADGGVCARRHRIRRGIIDADLRNHVRCRIQQLLYASSSPFLNGCTPHARGWSFGISNSGFQRHRQPFRSGGPSQGNTKYHSLTLAITGNKTKKVELLLSFLKKVSKLGGGGLFLKNLNGKTVLITGGASGIGRLMGRRFLDQGATHLVIWDIQEQALHETVAALSAEGFRVSGYAVDLADPARIQAAADEVRAAGIAIDIVVNNAGVIVGKTFVEHSSKDISLTMDVNTLAPIYVAKEFLPGMIARGTGHIVNIASAAGFVPNPKMSVYCASKWAMIGWSDSLRVEMERAKTGVGVTTVTPYYIDTGMFAGVRSPFIPILKAEYVADRVIAAIKSDRIFLRLPWIINLVPLLRGILPLRWFDKIGGEWLRIYHTMDNFRGRK